MFQEITNFILDLPNRLGAFGQWLFTPLPYINMPPLAIFSIGGVAVLLGIHLVRLFVGG